MIWPAPLSMTANRWSSQSERLATESSFTWMSRRRTGARSSEVGGRIAQSMRALLKVAAVNEGVRVQLEIGE